GGSSGRGRSSADAARPATRASRSRGGPKTPSVAGRIASIACADTAGARRAGAPPATAGRRGRDGSAPRHAGVAGERRPRRARRVSTLVGIFSIWKWTGDGVASRTLAVQPHALLLRAGAVR